MKVCDATVNGNVLGEATNSAEALIILDQHFRGLGVSVTSAKIAQVLLRDLDQPRSITAWVAS